MGAKTADPTKGHRFGRWQIQDGIAVSRGREKYFHVTCDCGNTGLIAKGNLVSGRATSCGCYGSESSTQRFTTHGKRKDPIYAVWNMIVQRCHLPTNKAYPHYGGRGIQVSTRWRTFEYFYADMGDAPFKGAQIDRINNDAGYSKENCRWVTAEEQQANTTKSVVYDFQGQKLGVAQIAKIVGMNRNTLYTRIYTYGMSMEDATSIPVMSPQQAQDLIGNPLFEKVKRRRDGAKLYGGAVPAPKYEIIPNIQPKETT